MKYILITCSLVIVIISIRTFNNLKRKRARKKWQELKKKEQADREVRLAPLRKEKQKVDKNLSIEKNVTCDDGITRIYKGSMFGIIKEHQNNFTVSYIESTDEVENYYINDFYDIGFELDDNIVEYTNKRKSREIINQKWFSWRGKKLNVDEILKLNKRYHSLNRRYNERFEDILETMKTNGPIYRKLICINDYYFMPCSNGYPEKPFSGTIDGVAYINGLAIQNEIENTKRNETENLSSRKEHVKSNLNFDNLDEETKKFIENQTMFVDEDGSIDESRGLGKRLTNKLRFFVENINGINEDDISWDLTNETKPENDIDGKWHFKNGLHLMKCFSNENFEIEITDFLVQNGISKDSTEYKIDMKQIPLIPIAFYQGNKFTVEIPQIENESYKLVVILENDNSTESNLVEQELMTTIFDEANKFQDENNHEEAIRCYKKIIDRIDEEKDNIANNNLIIETVINLSSEDNLPELIGTPIDGVYFNLGQSYLALQDFTEAKKAFEKAIEVNSNTEAMVYHHLGVTKIQLGDFTTCIEDFTNSLKIDENHFDSYYMRAVAYTSENSELQDISKAKKDLKVYLNQYPEDGAANRLLDAIN